MIFFFLLQTPVLGKDGITYVVIHCDNVEHAMRKLSSHTAHVVEYVVRFVARMSSSGHGGGLDDTQRQELLMRLVSALTHQVGITQIFSLFSGKSRGLGNTLQLQ